MKKETKRILKGTVASVYQNTIIVSVETKKKHPLYNKYYKQTKKYPTDADVEAGIGVGDVVTIIETRPISKTKRFRLKEIVEKSII